MSFFPGLGAVLAAATSEVEFNCPWCNTRLALSQADFRNERAVLCPKCSNPIDLDIQRRLARTPTRGKQEAARGQVTASKPAPPVRAPPAPPAVVPSQPAPVVPSQPSPVTQMPSAPDAPSSSQPAQPGGAMRYNPSTLPGPTAGMDWSKPVDIATTFKSVERPDHLDFTQAAATKQQPGDPKKSPYGNKLHCPACGYENVRVPPEFSFGTVAKCAWCGKELPV
jgi:transcription elongation factor Elf1